MSEVGKRKEVREEEHREVNPFQMLGMKKRKGGGRERDEKRKEHRQLIFFKCWGKEKGRKREGEKER